MTTSDAPAAATARWLDEREQGAWRSLLLMQAELSAQLGRELQDESGLSNADFSVLVQLSEHPEQRVRILELARHLQWEKSRLSHQLRRMQQRGLLDRSNCSEDRRGAFVVLTEAGRAAIEAAAPRHVDAVRRYLFDHLDAADVDTLYAITEGVLQRLNGVRCAPDDAVACGDSPGEADACDGPESSCL